MVSPRRSLKNKRSLSGVFFRHENPETGKWENWCFEDLPEDEQDMYMADRDIEWTRSLVKQLANTLNSIGDEYYLTTEQDDN